MDGKLSNLEALRLIWSKDHGLTTGERAVLNDAVIHTDELTQAQIAAETGLTVRAVRSILASLEDQGIIERSGTKGKASAFAVHLDRLPIANHRKSLPMLNIGREERSSYDEHRKRSVEDTPTRAGIVVKEVTAKQKRKKSSRPSVEGPWSKPAGKIWKQHMGGTIPQVRINTALSPLVAEHGADEVLKWWDKYLADPKSSARFKNPQDFASRFGAWRKEHSTNGSSESVVSVDDLVRCVTIGGSAVSMEASRELGFGYIEEKDPELWTRAGPTYRLMPHFQLYKLKDQPYNLRQMINAQLATLRNGHA